MYYEVIKRYTLTEECNAIQILASTTEASILPEKSQAMLMAREVVSPMQFMVPRAEKVPAATFLMRLSWIRSSTSEAGRFLGTEAGDCGKGRASACVPGAGRLEDAPWKACYSPKPTPGGGDGGQEKVNDNG